MTITIFRDRWGTLYNQRELKTCKPSQMMKEISYTLIWGFRSPRIKEYLRLKPKKRIS